MNLAVSEHFKSIFLVKICLNFGVLGQILIWSKKVKIFKFEV